MPERSLADERRNGLPRSLRGSAWRAQLEKYGWKGVSTRTRTQNHQSIAGIRNYDRLDPTISALVDFIYGELYRGISMTARGQ